MKKSVFINLTVGVVAGLLFSVGMSICMTEIGAVFGAYAMVVGIVVGIAGVIPAALAYPVYNRVLRKERQKLAPQILRLTDELLNEGHPRKPGASGVTCFAYAAQ